MKKILCSLLGLLLLLPVCVQAGLPEMKFRRLDTRDGLSNSQVNCVYRDSRGMVWIGTAYGLNRYDGYRFKTFYSNRQDTTSMRDNYTDQIMEGFDGKLWLRQGMNYCVFDPVTEKFERNISRELEKYGIKGGVERLYIDSKKCFWVKLYDKGFVYCDPIHKKYETIEVGYELNQFNPTYGVSWMTDYDGKLLITTYNGELVCLDGHRGVVEWEDKWMRQNGGMEGQEYRIFVDKRGNFYVSSPYYSFTYRAREKRWYQQLAYMLQDQGVEGASPNWQVWDVKADSKGRLWVATDHDGLIVVDMESRQLRQFLNDKFDESTISDNTLKNIYIDDLGGVWIGSYKNGVNQYVEGASSIRNLELGDINTVAEDRYGNYWIGSNDRGILVYNPKSGEVVQHYTTENSALSSNIMAGSYAASDGSIWFGSYNGGLVRCMPSKDHPTQATIHNYRATGDADGLAINNVWSVTEDRWHRIWIATLGGGIQMLDLKKGKFRSWNAHNTNLPGDYMTSVSWIKKGWLMVGTSWYYCFVNPVTGKLANRLIPEDPSVTVSTGSTVCVMEDSRGLIWQGSASGAVVYDPKHRFVTLLDMYDGLIGSSVCSITEDKSHTMWVVTDHGVSKIIPEPQDDGTWQFIVHSYSSSDGLQKATYNQRSTCLTHDGLLLIGGQGGLDVINPRGLTETKSKECPVFSGLQIFDADVAVGQEVNGRVILDEALDVCRDITLRYNDQFTIQLGSNMANVNNSKRFVYRLEGFNDNWVKTSPQYPNITYNSLRAGSYTLYVRMLNDDGTIGDEEAQMDITIRPPLWRSRWAFLLYMLLVAGVALLWRRWFRQRLERRMQVETTRRELEKKQWMNEMMMKLRQEHAANDAQNKSSDASPERVADDAAFHPLVLDIVPFLRELCDDYRSPDRSKRVKVTFMATARHLEVDADEEQLRDVFTTLFNNSVLFAHDDSLINVGAVRQRDGQVQIQVADNGIGIKDEYKEHAFDPMANGDGIGLDRVKDIVVRHGGTIRIEDNPGGGTIFVIVLPAASDIEEAVLLNEDE